MPPRLDNTKLLPRYAKKGRLACVSCQVPIEKLPNGSLLHPYLGWKEWQWWNCATQNGKCSPERPAKTRRAERELPFNIEQMFDDVPPLHQQRCFCMTQDDGVDWNRGTCFWWWNGGNTFLVHKFILSRICIAQAMLRHMVNWAHGHPAPPQARTKRALEYKMESWDKGVQHTRMYIYVLCTNINAYMFTCFFIYVSIYIYIYLSIHFLKYPLIYWLIYWFNWCTYS